MHGIREVQIYNQQNAFKRCFASFAEPSIKAQACQAVYPALPNWILETTGMCLLLAAIVLMADRGDSVAITGTLTPFGRRIVANIARPKQGGGWGFANQV